MITICDVCRQDICPSRCPNYKETPVVYWCNECKEAIYDGEIYYNVYGKKFCEECIEDFKHFAEVEDYWVD